MISNKCIVCTPLTTWDNSIPNTVVKMMELLSRENRILFVDYQYTYKDILTTVKGRKNAPLGRMFGFKERLRKVVTEHGSELHILTPPPVFPVNWIRDKRSYEFFLRVNAAIVKQSIRRAVRKLKMEDIILINGYNPFLGLPLAGQCRERLHVYYCYDEIRGDIWYNYHGPRVEEAFMKKADVVITTSDALYASKSCINPCCYVVKNGVDFNMFHPVAYASRARQNSIVAGYTGSIDERFDIETMSYVISALPGVKFEFVGRIPNEQAGRMLASFSNVTLHGPKRPEEVPQYMRNMDVCIIPYLKNDVTRGVYPLKINEYLAAGKPVVMTDFAPLREFEGIVGIARSKEAFAAEIMNQLSGDSEEKKNKRIELARSNSWENRAEELSYILENCLAKNSKVLV